MSPPPPATISLERMLRSSGASRSIVPLACEWQSPDGSGMALGTDQHLGPAHRVKVKHLNDQTASLLNAGLLNAGYHHP